MSFGTCRFGDADIDGAAVQLAAEIAAHAAADEILVSDAARALLGGSVKLAARGALPGDGARLHAIVPESG